MQMPRQRQQSSQKAAARLLICAPGIRLACGPELLQSQLRDYYRWISCVSWHQSLVMEVITLSASEINTYVHTGLMTDFP